MDLMIEKLHEKRDRPETKKKMFNCYVAGPFCLKDNEMSEPKPPSEGGL